MTSQSATSVSTKTNSVDRFEQWKNMAALALRGLRETYNNPSTPIPYTRRYESGTSTVQGQSIRYALISLIGLAKGNSMIGDQSELVTDLWQCIAKAGGVLAMNTGDLGLALWASALHKFDFPKLDSKHVYQVFQQTRHKCDSVDLAWLLTGADQQLWINPDNESAMQLNNDVKHNLLSLYNAQTSLFYRDARSGLTSFVSRRIACFANQIYPVMSFSIHYQRTKCTESSAIVAAVADKLCNKQGDRGQWWWLYDADSGEVVDGYPVYSVHQDGMAPMALMEASIATQKNYNDYIDRGFQWIDGNNEMNTSMILQDQGLIYRDIHKKGIGRIRRMIDGTLWCMGWQKSHSTKCESSIYEINQECRPYHPGWILYAAGMMKSKT